MNRDFFNTLPKSDPNDSATHHDIQLLRTATEELAGELQTHQHSYADVLAARLDAADEELELLWWAFSDYSALAHDRWAHLGSPEAALLCGIEFGNKLEFEVELPSTEALLARLLGPDIKEPVALATAVEAAASFLDSMKLPDGHPLLPILSCISEYRALHGKPSWQGSVDRWDIDPGHSVEKLAFARQAVLERTLMGNISDG